MAEDSTIRGVSAGGAVAASIRLCGE